MQVECWAGSTLYGGPDGSGVCWANHLGRARVGADGAGSCNGGAVVMRSNVVARLLSMFEAGEISESRLALCLEAYELMVAGVLAAWRAR